jgi:hypothetical protein
VRISKLIAFEKPKQLIARDKILFFLNQIFTINEKCFMIAEFKLNIFTNSYKKNFLVKHGHFLLFHNLKWILLHLNCYFTRTYKTLYLKFDYITFLY